MTYSESLLKKSNSNVMKSFLQLVDTCGVTIKDVVKHLNENEIESLKNFTPFKTLIKITTKDKKGKTKSFLTHNTCVMGGRMRVIESQFGKKPIKEQHLLLNELLEIPHSVDIFSEGSNHYKDLCVKGFCVGDGARNPQNLSQEFKVGNHETKLYNILPLRCVEETSDLSLEDQKKYRGRKKTQINGKNYILYYFKLVESEKIFAQHEGSDYIPKFSDTTPLPKKIVTDVETGQQREESITNGPNGSSSPVFIFTKFNINIEAVEIKEYFKLIKNGSLVGAGINEIGLVMGVDLLNNQDGDTPRNELADCELWAKLTFPHQTLEAEAIAIDIQYIVYA